jgi:hypothetical protein
VQAVAANVNLGAQGTVLIFSGNLTFADAYDATNSIGFTTVFPSNLDRFDTALLTPAAPPATPLPPSFVLVLTGLAGASLYQVRRKFARAN